MSLFTTPTTRYRKTPEQVAYDKLHWTKQLELQPLGERQRRTYEQGDSDTRLDNWEVDDEPQDNQ